MAFLYRRYVPVLLLLLAAPFALYFGVILRRVPSRATARPTLRVTVLNVGTGEAALIRTPGGATILIGTGSSESGETVAQVLQNAGVKRVDLLVLPYPYAEAIGGVPAIYETFEVLSVLEGNGNVSNPYLENARRLGREYQTDWRMVQSGDRLAFPDNVSVEILAPSLPSGNRSPTDNSLVVAVRYGETRFLFAGGLAKNGERALLAATPALAADFLRAARFGNPGASSPEFLRLVNPEFVAVSVGPNGDGFPAPETLARLRDTGATILRTDDNGGQSPTFMSDGRTVKQE
ncbi:MAG: hypothetical protein H7Y38_02330 [Armatimonadetes bacterium]|nr:hypothetical protein [Armatimonadota bacterium]